MTAGFILVYPEELLRVSRLLSRSEMELLAVCLCLVRWGNQGYFTIQDLMAATGRSRTSAYRKMAKLKASGLIKGRGGHWVISPKLCMKGKLSRADQVADAFNHFGRVPEAVIADLQVPVGKRPTEILDLLSHTSDTRLSL